MTEPWQLLRQPMGWWSRTNRCGVVNTRYEFSTVLDVFVEQTYGGTLPVTATASGTVNTPVTFDSIGDGYSANAAAAFDFPNTAVAGTYVILDMSSSSCGPLTEAPTYDDVPMTLLGSVNLGDMHGIGKDGYYFRYGIGDVPGGEKTVAVSMTYGAWVDCRTVMYTGVNSVGTTTATAHYSSSNLTQTVSDVDGLVVQGFGAGCALGSMSFSGLDGGTNRIANVGAFGYTAIIVNETTEDDTFTATGNYAWPFDTVIQWAGMATPLSS